MKKFKEMDFVDKINDELTLIFKSLFLRSLKIEGTTLNNKKFILETFVPEGEPTIPDSQCLKTQYFRLKIDGFDSRLVKGFSIDEFDYDKNLPVMLRLTCIDPFCKAAEDL